MLDLCVLCLGRSVIIRVQLSATPWTVARQATLSMGILQARTLEWIAILSSRGSFQLRDWTQVSCIASRFFTIWATREVILQVSWEVLVERGWAFHQKTWVDSQPSKHTCWMILSRAGSCLLSEKTKRGKIWSFIHSFGKYLLSTRESPVNNLHNKYQPHRDQILVGERVGYKKWCLWRSNIFFF